MRSIAMSLHLHLDPLGGIAGDMFAAALLDLRPDLLPDVERALEPFGLRAGLAPASDGPLSGRRFEIVDRTHEHGHAHTHWSRIRADLLDGRLAPEIARIAVGIFGQLARAEARIHGVPEDAVAFHEVGAADSIGDIVAASVLIERTGVVSTSVSALPLGGGRIETAHGIMPVPAPATALLLEGLETIDDGIGGERVTPTGAAILAHLAPTARRTIGPARLLGTGFGFGTRRLAGIANCLRAMLSDPARPTEAKRAGIPHRRLAVLSFEIDDQTGEDLARGIERIRATPGVHDVVQIPAIGKKGRFAFHLQVLTDRDAAEAAIAACFAETTTIGLRHAEVEGRALSRSSVSVAAGQDSPVRVKLVDRPGGRSGKPEADDIARGAGDASSRARLRTEALARALDAERT